MSAPSPCSIMQTPKREFAGAKLLLFFDICKMVRDFSMRIMPKEMFSGKIEKTDCYANPETGVVMVFSLFRSVNVVLILC